jgi:hypothetical protein
MCHEPWLLVSSAVASCVRKTTFSGSDKKLNSSFPQSRSKFQSTGVPVTGSKFVHNVTLERHRICALWPELLLLFITHRIWVDCVRYHVTILRQQGSFSIFGVLASQSFTEQWCCQEGTNNNEDLLGKVHHQTQSDSSKPKFWWQVNKRPSGKQDGRKGGGAPSSFSLSYIRAGPPVVAEAKWLYILLWMMKYVNEKGCTQIPRHKISCY